MDLFEDTEKKGVPFSILCEDDCQIQWDNDLEGYNIVVPNGELFYAENYFDAKISDRCVEYFQENDTFDWRSSQWKEILRSDLNSIRFKNINWKQETIKLYGNIFPLPRLTAWYGDSGKNYTYSGITSKPNEWNKGLLYIKKRIELCAGVVFNSVLLNWYRDGEDHLSWHSDDEKELGINPTIASVNFGEERDFIIRRKDDRSKKMVFPLGHGTILIMRGELQNFWEHTVPRRKRVEASRFNLTFRFIGERD